MSDDTTRVEHVFKLLVTGPFAAGKTTLIRTVSDAPVVETEVHVTGSGPHGTTMMMDLGTYTLPRPDRSTDDVRLMVFGTPGEQPFRSVVDSLKGEVDAIVFVVAADDEHTHREAADSLRSLVSDLRVPLVIAVNRCDDRSAAEQLVRSFGVNTTAVVVPCQLDQPDSGREVVVEALVAVLVRSAAWRQLVVDPHQRTRARLAALPPLDGVA